MEDNQKKTEEELAAQAAAGQSVPDAVPEQAEATGAQAQEQPSPAPVSAAPAAETAADTSAVQGHAEPKMTMADKLQAAPAPAAEAKKPISRKEANAIVAGERTENALRDFSWYREFNSYGKEFNADQLQNSMQPADIRAFQKSVGLPGTGIVDRRTYAELKAAYDGRDDLKNQFRIVDPDDGDAEAKAPADETEEERNKRLKKNELNKRLLDWVRRNRSSEPKDFSPNAVIELQDIMNGLRTIEGREVVTYKDNIFGRQTMTDFYDLLRFDPKLEDDVRRNGMEFDADGNLTTRPYQHILDRLRSNYNTRKNEYERNWNLRNNQRNAKFQRFADMTNMVRSMITASGGAKVTPYDPTNRYDNLDKYNRENQATFTSREDQREKDYLNLLKKQEDERRRRFEANRARQDKLDEDATDNDLAYYKEDTKRYTADRNVAVSENNLAGTRASAAAQEHVADSNLEGKKYEWDSRKALTAGKDGRGGKSATGKGKNVTKKYYYIDPNDSSIFSPWRHWADVENTARQYPSPEQGVERTVTTAESVVGGTGKSRRNGGVSRGTSRAK